MQQLAQKLKNGEMKVIEVPPPVSGPGLVTVKNHFSVISPGTERNTVTAARKNVMGKASARPQQAKQAVELLRQQGPAQAYRAVMKRLEAHSPLGYSSAGEVIEAASDVKGFSPGDLVACGGAGYANHAELVAVPSNLCVKLPDGTDLKKAAYNTLGAIALQGIRQADLSIGESCAVIGLGLIGQLTCLILRASGIKVVGIDIDSNMVEVASKNCADMALNREERGLVQRINEFTRGIGADAVIITASADTCDPINLAGEIVRQKGKVVVVGNVPTGFERDHYYRKELQLKMSCSYGPGRYDIKYEEKGLDYPVGYVRWTENRNMQAFQELVHSGRIHIDYLTTHTFKLEDAPAAYDMIVERKEPFLGILIEYDTAKEHRKEKVVVTHASCLIPQSSVGIGFIGAGSYVRNYLLPNIPKDKDVILKGVMTASGTSSRTVAEKYGFEFCTSNEGDIYGDDGINTVFIATRHNTHADYALKALKAGKHVFVEKPLCTKESELADITETYSSLTSQHSTPSLMVGFNRRFSPLAKILKERLGVGPMAMIYRINAGPIPSNSWIQDPDIGGGRIIGEVCHFVDFLTFLNGSLPQCLFATAMQDPAGTEDTVNVNLRFRNGSIGTVSYFSDGSKSFFKEYVESHRAGTTAVLNDFRELEIHDGKRTFRKRLFYQDKGQKQMVKAFVESIGNGKSSPVPFHEISAVTLATLKILHSLRTGEVCQLSG